MSGLNINFMNLSRPSEFVQFAASLFYNNDITVYQVETERFTLVVKRLEEDKKEAGRRIRDLNEESKQLKRNVNRLFNENCNSCVVA